MMFGPRNHLGTNSTIQFGMKIRLGPRAELEIQLGLVLFKSKIENLKRIFN